jgi:histidinol-phosphate aminotransferase
MVRIRPEVRQIVAYTPGKPEDEVARELGLTDIAKLASNECPEPPFPEVERAIAAAAAGVHRYPDNDRFRLTEALSKHLGVPRERILIGAGSTELLLCLAGAVGGGGSMVYAWPSFVMYRIAAKLGESEAVEVPLDAGLRHDPDALVAAVRNDTRALFVCNPNNPTGTYISGEAVRGLIQRVPEDVLVVIDEAYHEYVREPDYETMLPLAAERDNVVVTRTFSKVYGLAGLRVGYAVGSPELITELRKVQAPFSVSDLAQAAAIEALRHQRRVEERVRRNTAALERFRIELEARGVEHPPSQANFVSIRPGGDEVHLFEALLERGVIVRPMSQGWLRVTVGTEEENTRFFSALDSVLAARRPAGAVPP